MRKLIFGTAVVFLLLGVCLAKNDPGITLLWPVEKPAIKLTFEKFHQQGSYAGQNSYISEVTVQNLTDKQIPRATFTVFLLDKSKVRIGQALLQVADLEGGQTAKLQFSFYSVGVPASLTISAKKDMLAAKTIPLKIVSVPPGAILKVDGEDAGLTPVIYRFTVGAHQINLTKEGYAPGNTPPDVSADELPGGSITIELGGLSRDTVELRDGTVLLGDVMSMSLTQIVIRMDGKDQNFDRNQVKKLILVQREITETPVIQPAPSAPSQAHP